MTQFTMFNLYRLHEYDLSLFLALEETLFVLHTDRGGCVGTAGMEISG